MTIQTGAITAVSAAADVLIFVLAPVSLDSGIRRSDTSLLRWAENHFVSLLALAEPRQTLAIYIGISFGILLFRSYIQIPSWARKSLKHHILGRCTILNFEIDWMRERDGAISLVILMTPTMSCLATNRGQASHRDALLSMARYENSFWLNWSFLTLGLVN